MTRSFEKVGMLRLREPIRKANRLAALSMTGALRMTLGMVIVGMWLGLASCPVSMAQQGAATGEPLMVRTTSLPNGYVGQEYEAKLTASGGILPLEWELKEGSLPPGMSLHEEGDLIGVPSEAGEFHFTVTVKDSGRPGQEKAQKLELVVVKALFLKWGTYPTVNGRRVEGSVLVSNQTDADFDLTVIVVAVDENGRATALGYQHFPLRKDTSELEIPFGDNLARGSYQINVDAVGESGTATIYRARLAPKERLVVAAGP